MTKKEKELNPIAEKVENPKFELAKQVLMDELDKANIFESNTESSDSFFKAVINHLVSDEDISTKTEYLNVQENFAGTKLHFLALHGNIPYLKDFINIFEKKRVSLQRKGRKELLMALKERQQELERERQQQLNKLTAL